MGAKTSVQAFFDAATGTVSYVVACVASKRAAIVDPVLDFDLRSGRTATRSADGVLAHVRATGLQVEWILPSLQVNVRGGRLPPPADNGIVYLRVPVDALGARSGATAGDRPTASRALPTPPREPRRRRPAAKDARP